MVSLNPTGTQYGRIDTEDAIAAPAFLVGSMVSTGIATINLFGHDLGGEAFAVGGTSLTFAFIVSVGALAFAWLSNEPELEKMDDPETYVTVATVLLLLGSEFIGAVNDIVTSSDAVGVVALVVMAAGYYAISYLG